MIDICVFNGQDYEYQSALLFVVFNLVNEMISTQRIQEQSIAPLDSQAKSLFQRLKIKQTILKEKVKTLKNYDTWRKTKLLRINTEEMKRIENESLLSVAFNCGFRNEMNQIFDDVFKRSNKYISTQNSDQQHRFYDKTASKGNRNDKKKISFVEYKTTKEQLLKVTRNLTPQINKDKQSTQPRLFNKKLGFDQTPREISHLRQAMKTLPIMQKKDKSQHQQNKKHIKTTQQITNFSKQNKKNHTQRDVFEKCENLQNKHIINKKMSFFKRRVDEIMSNADSLLQNQAKKQLKQKNIVSRKHKSLQVKSNKTTYWPQYKKYSISVEDKHKINKIRSQYKQVFDQDFAFEDYILQIIRNMKQDFTQIEQQQKIEIVQAIKNAFELRFKYKINVEKDKYKRNVKSYLKCILDYRNERKKEEVKANGIRRFKRQTLMQKIKMLVPQKNEDFQI